MDMNKASSITGQCSWRMMMMMGAEEDGGRGQELSSEMQVEDVPLGTKGQAKRLGFCATVGILWWD